MSEAERLSSLSKAIRISTLKRLHQVPQGKHGYSPDPKIMSFADIAHHLIEADQWLFKKLKMPDLASMRGDRGEAGQLDNQQFADLLVRLERVGEDRSEILSRLSVDDLATPIPDDRFDGVVSTWWVIVRGNLDHEAHHRGQLTVYLRMCAAT